MDIPKEDLNKQNILDLKEPKKSLEFLIKNNSLVEEKAPIKLLKKKNKKCSNCKKNLSLINFDCKCGKSFCNKCRMPEFHNCTFDWMKEGKEQLKIDNPKIVFSKIQKC